MDQCPCGSGRTLGACCGPYIDGKARAPTAESLMRSRYSAYVLRAIDYIVATCVAGKEDGIDPEATRKWSEGSDWKGLEVRAREGGGEGDREGSVEFVATYASEGLIHKHHERAEFVRGEGGEWLYKSGDMVPETVVRSGAKVGRNEPCPCGSGKKFKNCCGR